MDAPTYSLDELARHDGRDGTYWIAVKGEIYDVTDFVSRHPGGSSMLELGAGREATVLFESYHPGASLARAHRVLGRHGKHLGRLDPADADVYGDPEFFETVQTRVHEHLGQRGLDVHSGATIAVVEALVVVLITLVAWYARAFHASYIGAVVAGLMMGRMGFLMHSGNHSALGRKTRRNSFAAALMEYMGGSSFVWRYAHQVAHHGKPNIYGADNDCEIGVPLLRFHPKIERRPIHRIQHIGLAIGMSIGLVKWIITDVVALSRGRIVHASFFVSSARWWRAMLYKALWLVGHVIVPVILLGPLHGLLTTFVMLAVGAYYMEGVFIVNHIQDGLVPPGDCHWAEQQVRGTANWSSGSRFANFISGGLNHQIEHHLFPSMAVHLYPIIAPVVRKTCEEYRIPYRDYSGFFPALWGTVSFLHALGWSDSTTDDAEPDVVSSASEVRGAQPLGSP